jgi:hypothetical protein
MHSPLEIAVHASFSHFIDEVEVGRDVADIWCFWCVLPGLMDTVGVVVSSSLLDTRSVFRIFSFFCAFRILLGFGVEA